MKDAEVLRKELLALLEGGNAHMGFADAVADLAADGANEKPPNCPYSIWHTVEHIRISQWDILRFILDPKHESPPWPEGYRPKPETSCTPATWKASVEAVQKDLEALKALVLDPSRDPFAPLPHAPAYTLFREILLAADHTAHHVGEILMMRQVLGLWPKERPYLTGRP